MGFKVAAGLVHGDDGVARCYWIGSHADYRDYHDHEWGRPDGGDERLFEKLCLEGFQAGLSWLTILRKRPAFRRAFGGFDPRRVARFGPSDVERLVGDAAIIRNRAKIESAIHNARRAIELIEEHGSLARYLWRFRPARGERPRRITRRVLQGLTESPSSRALSADLKRRGWTFVGPTTMYALMQSMGLVNDHLEGCALREEVELEQTLFEPL
jgi:DNA-3-methyladenine glycosylase I